MTSGQPVAATQTTQPSQTPFRTAQKVLQEPAAESVPADAQTEKPLPSAAEQAAADGNILVYLVQTGTVESLSLRQYCIGAVAAEMPASYPMQALCAQAAACLNLARKAIEDGTAGRPDGAHLTSSPSTGQAYMTEEELRAYWGSTYDTCHERIVKAVDTVLPYAIVSEDALCLTAFHAVSSGRTETSENIWVSALPYLRAVDSSFDSSSPDYYNEMLLSATAFAAGLQPYGFEATQDADRWLGEAVYSDSGTLLSLEIGNIVTDGRTLCSVFGLRSAAVQVSCTDGSFLLVTRGCGHGVGMSQYGAQQLALQGKTWQEIIYHYYTGVQILPVQQ